MPTSRASEAGLNWVLAGVARVSNFQSGRGLHALSRREAGAEECWVLRAWETNLGFLREIPLNLTFSLEGEGTAMGDGFGSGGG